MAWDFSTEPEFEAKLEWMRGFVRDEIIPLETPRRPGDRPGDLRADHRPAEGAGEGQGLWAAHLPPELGGGGFGQVKLGLMHEILGRCATPRASSATTRPTPATPSCSPSAATEEQKERWMQPAAAPGELRSCFSMTEPGAGADPTLLVTRAVLDGDEWVINGHKWFSSNASVADFLIVMCVTDPDVSPYQGSSMIIVPADTPGVDILRDIPTMDHPERSRRRARRRPRRDHLPRRAGAEGEPRRQPGRRLPARPAAPRPGPDPPRDALARPVAAGVRHAVRAGRQPLHARLGAGRQADGAGLVAPSRPPRCRPPG